MILWTAKVMNKTQKSMGPLIFWPDTDDTVPYDVSADIWGQFNYVRLFLRIISWVCYGICSFFVSGTIIWLFIELSEQILIFSVFSFFWWFWWEKHRKSMNFLKNHCLNQEIHGFSKIFASKSSKKRKEKEKNQNLLRQFYKQSYVRAGNEKETESIKNAWTDPGKSLITINCRAPKIAWLRWLETFFGWKA